jgi:hypothetical protein
LTKHRRELSVIADEIRVNLKRETAAIITTGGLLIEAQKQVDHGEWLPWLKREFSLSERSAQRYMRAFKFAVKYDTVADLNMSPTALYLLTEKEDDFPPAVIHGLFRQATKGRVGKDDVWENYRSYWNGKKIEDWEEAQCRAQSKPTEPTAVERAETHRRWVEEEARREAEAGAEPEPQPEPKHEPEVISKNAMLALRIDVVSIAIGQR